MFIFFNLLSLI